MTCVCVCVPKMSLENDAPAVVLQDSYIQSRADTMQNIESTIVELGSIFQQLAHMVKEQEETIQRCQSQFPTCSISIHPLCPCLPSLCPIPWQDRCKRGGCAAECGGGSRGDPQVLPVGHVQPVVDGQDLPHPHRLLHRLRCLLGLRVSFFSLSTKWDRWDLIHALWGSEMDAAAGMGSAGTPQVPPGPPRCSPQGVGGSTSSPPAGPAAYAEAGPCSQPVMVAADPPWGGRECCPPCPQSGCSPLLKLWDPLEWGCGPRGGLRTPIKHLGPPWGAAEPLKTGGRSGGGLWTPVWPLEGLWDPRGG